MTMTSSQARNISGYLSGLSSPSATDETITRCILADPELGRADEVADVLDDEQVELVERQRRKRRAHHVRVEVTLAAEARVGVDLRDGHVQAGDAVGVERRSLHVALEHAHARPRGRREGGLEQGRLARAREHSSGSRP